MKKSPLKPEYVLGGTVFILTLIGFAVRLGAPLQATFPLNDGGLFYAMIADLRNAHYALPAFATYNGAEIPFAYPPLAFYLTGLLADITGASLLDLLRLLPAFVSGLTVPAFFLLARQMTDSKIQTGLAVFAFAVLPRTMTWLIMGGGITRSFGLLFALLTMTFAYKLYAHGDQRAIWGAILFGALVVVTHPEATVHTAITALLFYLWKDRSLKGLLASLGITAGILILSSPWWGTVLARHGLGPFLASLNAAGQNSYNKLVGLVIFFRFLFAGEPYLTVLSSIGAIGLFASLSRRQGLLPVWLFMLHFFEPRGGELYMMIPLALLIGLGLDAVILPALNGARPQKEQQPENAEKRSHFGRIAQVFLTVLLLYTSVSALSEGFRIYHDLSLHTADLETTEWVQAHTPADSTFLLVTAAQPLRDAWSEWFPVLTGRKSQATLFGYEWVNDGRFGERVAAYEALQSCMDAVCLEQWASSTNSPFDYLLIQTNERTLPLQISLSFSADYQLVYENENAAIFAKQQKASHLMAKGMIFDT